MTFMLFENFVIGLVEHWAPVSSVGVVTSKWDVRRIPAGEGCSVLHTCRLNLIACAQASPQGETGAVCTDVQLQRHEADNAWSYTATSSYAFMG